MPYYKYQTKGAYPMAVIQINFGKGWEPTCYKPMNKWDAERIAKGLANVYTSYQYRVVDEAR